MKALRSLILLEERVGTLSRKVEAAADQLVALDKRLVRIETVVALTLRETFPRIEGPAP
jgi:hypothetical protein